MEVTRTIKIFLASSDELGTERAVIGDLVRRLNKMYEKRGLQVDLFKWEDFDAAYNNRRKQDEYNDEIRASDMFMALFWKKAGVFTIEEFDVAIEEYKKTQTKPKTYVFCRDLAEGEKETEELANFKKRLSQELGYYWIRYGNNDSLCFQFVMQLQLVETSTLDEVKVEGGVVFFNSIPIARMDDLPFARLNLDYQRMSCRLAELPGLLEEARLLVDKNPEDNEIQDNLQRLLDERNQLQEQVDRQQSFFLKTAKRIARIRGEKITSRMRRAIDTFERGDVHEANIILDEAEHDAKRGLDDYLQSKELTEQKRQGVASSIEELLLKASIMISDLSLKIEERIGRVDGLFSEAERISLAIGYDKKKYAEMLNDYGLFLTEFGRYNESIAVFQRAIPVYEETYGNEHHKTASAYNNFCLAYAGLGNPSLALSFLKKALPICERTLGEENPDTQSVYDNIGTAYTDLGDFPHALEYHEKALAIRKRVYGEEHESTALTYHNICSIYRFMGDYSSALDYHEKVIAIFKRVFGEEHRDLATTYNNLGGVYLDMGNYPMAMAYYEKALAMRKKLIGENHPFTATTYVSIGNLFRLNKDYSRALEYTKKGLSILERNCGIKHHDTAGAYEGLGSVYSDLGDFSNALKYYFKALATLQSIFGEKHYTTAAIYNDIGSVYAELKDYSRAIENFQKCVTIEESLLGENRRNTTIAVGYYNIGFVFAVNKYYLLALDYLEKALKILEEIPGEEHPLTPNVKEAIRAIESRAAWASRIHKSRFINKLRSFILSKK